MALVFGDCWPFGAATLLLLQCAVLLLSAYTARQLPARVASAAGTSEATREDPEGQLKGLR